MQEQYPLVSDTKRIISLSNAANPIMWRECFVLGNPEVCVSDPSGSEDRRRAGAHREHESSVEVSGFPRIRT